jgi:hypothetical protein
VWCLVACGVVMWCPRMVPYTACYAERLKTTRSKFPVKSLLTRSATPFHKSLGSTWALNGHCPERRICFINDRFCVVVGDPPSGAQDPPIPFHHLFVIPFIGPSLRYCLTTSLSSSALLVVKWIVLLVKLPGTMIHVSITQQVNSLPYVWAGSSIAAFAAKKGARKGAFGPRTERDKIYP